MRVIVLVALVACNPHNDARVEIEKKNCMPCHTAAKGQLAHPEAMFPIASGPHSMDDEGQPMQCWECHDFRDEVVNSGMMGVNANCTSTCHVRAESDPQHTGVAGYAWDDTAADFCLGCHPKGLAQ